MRKLMGKMDIIRTSEGDDKIYAAKHIDSYTKRKSYILVVEMSNGGYTPPIFHPILKTEPEDFEYLAEYGKEISAVDYHMVANYIKNNFADLKTLEFKDKMDIRDVFKAILQYCTDNEISSKEGYYNIPCEDFSSIISGCGHKALDFKRLMAQNDMIQVTPSRSYDYGIKIKDKDGNPKNKWHMSINEKDLKEEVSERDSLIKENNEVIE